MLFDNRIDNLNRSSALFSGGAIGEIKNVQKKKKQQKLKKQQKKRGIKKYNNEIAGILMLAAGLILFSSIFLKTQWGLLVHI